MAKSKWVLILLNLWAVIAILMMAGIVMVLTFEKPAPIAIAPLFIFGGVIVAGILCGISFIKLLTESNEGEGSSIDIVEGEFKTPKSIEKLNKESGENEGTVTFGIDTANLSQDEKEDKTKGE